jgi:dephospho-CoA kinase
MKKPLLVALTGGIGSGKTTVLNMFKEKGVPCYIADVEAKRLMAENPSLIEAIKNEFGEEAYTKEQNLNTSFLSSVVFNSDKKLEILNSIVHPAVKIDFRDWAKQQNSVFVIYESALVFEYNQQLNFDCIILVTAPIEERIMRVMKRSGLTKNDIKNRIKKQMDDNLKKPHSKYIIDNINIYDTKQEVDNIYQIIISNTDKIY